MTSGAQLNVVADLELEVDGIRSTLRDEGGRLVLRTDSPRAMWSALRTASLPATLGPATRIRAVGRLADVFGSAGIGFDVVGPRGPLVTIGRGGHSRLGRIATGSDLVQITSPAAVGSIVLGEALASRTLRWIGVAALAVAGTAFARRR